jgi:hypothetical protein
LVQCEKAGNQDRSIQQTGRGSVAFSFGKPESTVPRAKADRLGTGNEILTNSGGA